MKTLFALLCVAAIPLAAVADPKPAAEATPDAKYLRMTPDDLFLWAVSAPAEDKPWRVVRAIEMSQPDPAVWGYAVYPAFERALRAKWPKVMKDQTTVWRVNLDLIDAGESHKVSHPFPGTVSAVLWNMRVHDGKYNFKPKPGTW